MDDEAPHRVAGLTAVVTQLVALLGLPLAAIQLATGGDVLCPTDASCSAPWAIPALVAAPVLTALTAVVARAGRRGRWPLRLLLPILVVLVAVVLLLVVAGATYRIDVPRP